MHGPRARPRDALPSNRPLAFVAAVALVLALWAATEVLAVELARAGHWGVLGRPAYVADPHAARLWRAGTVVLVAAAIAIAVRMPRGSYWLAVAALSLVAGVGCGVV